MSNQKAHQRLIRDQKAETEASENLFGAYWLDINRDIKNAVVKETNTESAKRIILEYEWLGTMANSSYHYGIFFDNHLAGVTCFANLRGLAHAGYKKYVGESYQDKGILLARGACVHWAHEHAGSKLISESLKKINEIGYKYAIAYSDEEAGEIGTLYQATNWQYLGKLKNNHYDLFYEDKLYMNDREIYFKYGTQNPEKVLDQLKGQSGFTMKKRVSKGRYIYLLGNKKEKRDMFSVLKDKILPYPKRSYAVEVSREKRTETIGEGMGQYHDAAQISMFDNA